MSDYDIPIFKTCEWCGTKNKPHEYHTCDKCSENPQWKEANHLIKDALHLDRQSLADRSGRSEIELERTLKQLVAFILREATP